MPAPLVSIITPSFNQASFLEQAIKSVLQQGYPNIEYLVVDGGSNDGSLEIIEKYSSRMAWWVSEADSGQAEAINKGLQRASGEIIAWLNSDDFYYPGAVAAAVEALRVYPQAGLVFSDVDSVDETGELINRMRFGDWGLEELMSFKIISQPGVFMRRSVLDKAGSLDTGYHYLLDHHLWLRMGLHAPIQYARGARWAAARFHSGAKNRAQAASFGREAFRIAEWLENDPAYRQFFPRLRRKVWGGAHRLDAFYLLDAGLAGAALRAYWRALRCDPPVVLRDWRRVGYAILSPLGLQGVRRAYLQRRQRRFRGE